MSQVATVLDLSQSDVEKLLASHAHLGTKHCLKAMEGYVHTRRGDGVHVIDVRQTWEKLVLAARILAAVENPADVVVCGVRNYCQRASLKIARYTGFTSLTGRFTPGTFTNRLNPTFIEPRVLIVNDPRNDHQAIREAAYCNCPVIAFCDTDAPLRYVDVAIPCNNKSTYSIGVMYWMLTREVLRIRGEIVRHTEWDVLPDMFFHRDPEEMQKIAKQIEDKEKKAAAAAAAPAEEEVKEAWAGEGEWEEEEEDEGEDADAWI
ncbi:40S ribosomal protein SA [Aduncisulcus paluster]|uniref:Small ribosomal subunit protein uS2 n=1 Tax=Aduncisulcus paluster TaxID=2918883 RepID=A0ABQ5JRN0_9EUKA|nr:40S ribosomal protein SA [Aduncisulcus paluster]